jgi:hypothetical protein
MEWLAEVEAKRAEEAPPPALMPSLDGPPHDLPRLIEVLDHHEAEYSIVGGAAHLCLWR